METIPEEDYLQISGLQHYRFCPRQWALIYLEQQWAENLRTTEGVLLHERAHQEGLRESRGDLLTVRGLRVFSPNLGLSGACDVVEFRRGSGVPLAGREGLWQAYPVEYKRGSPTAACCFAPRPCAGRKCFAVTFPKGRSFMGNPAAGSRWFSPRSCGRRCANVPTKCGTFTAGAGHPCQSGPSAATPVP